MSELQQKCQEELAGEVVLVPVSECVDEVLCRLRKVVKSYYTNEVKHLQFIRYISGVLHYRGYDEREEKSVGFNVDVWSFEISYHYVNSLEVYLCNLNDLTNEEKEQAHADK